METNCKFCGDLFNGHGNALYCSREHYMEAKKERNRILYAQRKQYDPILLNDQILAWFHQQDRDVVPLDTLHEQGFNETYYLKRVMVEGTTVLMTGVFGFSSYSNHELQIHNLTDERD